MNHLAYTSGDRNLNTMRNHQQVASLFSFLMASVPRRVKLAPSASPHWPLLMTLAMSSL